MKTLILILLFVLTACGGGGEGSVTPPEPPPVQTLNLVAHCIPPDVENVSPEGVTTCDVGDIPKTMAPIMRLELTNPNDTDFTGYFISPTIINGCGMVSGGETSELNILANTTIIHELGGSTCGNAIINSPNVREIYIYSGTEPPASDQHPWHIFDPETGWSPWDWALVNATCGEPVGKAAFIFRTVE